MKRIIIRLAFLALTIPFLLGASASTYSNVRVAGHLYADQWERVYNTTVASNTTSVTISNLNGDVDGIYDLRVRMVKEGSASCNIRLNNDSGTNYGYQWLGGSETTAFAQRGTANRIYLSDASSGGLYLSKTLIYAKSGFVRTVLTLHTSGISGTTVSTIDSMGWSWNNSADNLTSIVILSTETDGLEIGTNIELYKRSSKL